MNKRSIAVVTWTLLAALTGVDRAEAGPISPYWLTAGDQSVVYVVQGNSITQTINTTAIPNHEYPIAIADTVRTFAGVGTWNGREYQLDGSLTGNTYVSGGEFFSTWDGTTDAANFNYSLQQGSGQVIAYDRNWANPSVLFTADFAFDYDWGGITYDTSNDTLWVNRRGGSPEFRNYALDGTLLSSFTLTGDVANWGLAYEEATDSLWVLGGFGIGGWEIMNVSKSGSVLETVTIVGLDGNILGGEMALTSSVVAEPSTISLLGIGAVGFVVARRRRANKASR